MTGLSKGQRHPNQPSIRPSCRLTTWWYNSVPFCVAFPHTFMKYSSLILKTKSYRKLLK